MSSNHRPPQRVVALIAGIACTAIGASAQEYSTSPRIALQAQDIVGIWRAVGERPTAEGRGVPVDSTAEIYLYGDGVAVYVEGMVLTGTCQSGRLIARLDTSIPATGRSGKGRTHVAQRWELDALAITRDALEARFSVTHAGFQASEAAKNGVQTANLRLTRLDDGALTPQFVSATGAQGQPGTDYVFVAWEYAESSATDVDVLLQCDALGLNKTVRRGERGIIKAAPGDYRLVVRDLRQGPGDQPNWADHLFTLYAQPRPDMSIVVSTNDRSDPRAGMVQVLSGGREIVREYLLAN